jgi:hypothetical protein
MEIELPVESPPESIEDLFQRCPLVIIGDILEVDSTDDTLSIEFLITDIIKFEMPYSDTLHLQIPLHFWRTEPEHHADYACGLIGFKVADQYLMFADSTYRILCCGSRGRGFYLLYPFNDYYHIHRFWDVLFEEDILTDSDLIRLQNRQPLEMINEYRAVLSFPLNDKTIDFTITRDDDGFIANSDLICIDGLHSSVRFNRRNKQYLYCRDANDVTVTLTSDSRSVLRLVGSITQYENDCLHLELFPIKPFVENTSDLYDYIRTDRIEPVVFDIEMYLDIHPFGRIPCSSARFIVSSNDYEMYLNGEKTAYLFHSRFSPLALKPDCRYLIMQKSYLGMVDGESDFIVFEIDCIPENFQGDLLYNIYISCIEQEAIHGNVYIIDDAHSQPIWLCRYDMSIQ